MSVEQTMLVKTLDINDAELVNKASELVPFLPDPNKTDCFIPYIDEAHDEIRYLHFVFTSGKWMYNEVNSNTI